MSGINNEILSSCLEQDPKRVYFTGHLTMLAVVLAVTFDGLCGAGLNTIGFPLCILLLLGGLFLMKWYEGTPFNRQNVALLVPPLLFFATMVAVRDNPFLSFWNIAASKVFLLLLLYFGTTDSVLSIGFGAFLKLPWKVTGSAMVEAVPVIKDVSQSLSDRCIDNEKTLPVLRGILIAVPVLAIFIGLLSSADAMFSKVLMNMVAALIPVDPVSFLFHLVMIGAMTWLIIGGIAYALTHQQPIPRFHNEDVPERRQWRIGFTETTIVLGSVSLLFAVFIGVQSSYFFGGVHYAQSLRLVYSEYAHRGFWELVSVAVLTLMLVHGMRTLGRREETIQNRVFNGMGTLLVGLTLILLASAIQRMHAYESVYGATPLRLYVDGFIVWLGVALCWFVVTLWQCQERFAIGVIVCGVGYLATLNLMNPEVIVASRNIKDFERTGKLSMSTIEDLSSDAIPTLCNAYKTLPESRERTTLGIHLHNRWLSLKYRPSKLTERNLSREQAWMALKPIATELPVTFKEDEENTQCGCTAAGKL